jgi:hypothetical protein
LHRPATFSVTFAAEPDVDGIKALRALLKTALRRFGLRAIDVRQCALDAHPDERARVCSTREIPMSAFSDRIRNQKKGFFKVADFEDGKELTLTINHLDEEVEMFNEKKDILNFVETGQQFIVNQTIAEWLIDNLGDDPETWPDKRVTLFLAQFSFKGETKQGIHLKLPGSGDGTALPSRKAVSPPRKPEFDDDIPY